MVMYVNEFKTKGNKIETKDKIEPLSSGMSLKKSWGINCCKLERRLSLSLL